MKLDGPTTGRGHVCASVPLLAVFATHMLATTNRMIRTGRGAYESSRADEGPGPLTFLFFERWALVARDACGGLVIIDGCPLTGISPHRVRLRRILQRGPPTRTNPAHVATIVFVDFTRTSVDVTPICVDFLRSRIALLGLVSVLVDAASMSHRFARIFRGTWIYHRFTVDLHQPHIDLC